ncbi:MAG: hypothetical protein OGMRLDGQ_000045 [Candidatus Fervidibacter sp.]
MRGRISRKQHQLRAGRPWKLGRWLWCAPVVVLVAATVLVAFYGCGGGGGGGLLPSLTNLIGVDGLRQLTQNNPNAAAGVNNGSQASRLVNRYLNQNLAQNIRQSPHDALTNMVNRLGRVDELSNLLRQRPDLGKALKFPVDNQGRPADSDRDGWVDELTVDFDQLTPDDERTIIDALPVDTKFVPVSWRQGLKLFKGRCKITDNNPNDANQTQQEVKVECDAKNPVQITSPEPNRPKFKLLGAFKERVPKSVQQGQQQVQAAINFEGLTIEDIQTRDKVKLGDPQKQEWSPVMLSVADPQDPWNWDLKAIDWDEVFLIWIDDLGLVDLAWTLNSDGFSEFAFDDCLVPVGADWTFGFVPRSRRQAELAVFFTFTFVWADIAASCDALTFDVFLAGLNILLDDLPEEGWIDWVNKTDSELDTYLASLLNLPPGAELADAILTAEGFTTGLPQFMHDFVLALHYKLNLQTRPQGVQVTGDYPSDYAATFSGQSVGLPLGTFTLSGQVAFQFQTSPQQRISATFTNFRVEEFDATLNGTLAMTLNEGPQLAVNITATNFRWEFPKEQRGSANGTMQASLTLGQNGAVEQVITSQMNLTLTVTNLLFTPPQTYSATITVVQPLRWPVSGPNKCDFSVEGIMRVQGTIANQQVDMQVDFGADGECEKAKITSAGQSAIYNLETGLFEELTRLKGRLRVLQLPEHKPIRFSRRAGVAL